LRRRLGASVMTTVSQTFDTTPTASEAFGRFCASLHYDALPPVAVERVKSVFSKYR
jgi:hypothetical protein